MKAVAIMTPDPKYFVMKKASGGTCMRCVLAAAIGRSTPGLSHQIYFPPSLDRIEILPTKR